METMTKTTWLTWASMIVIVLAFTYTYLHISENEKNDNCINGQEIRYLDKSQLNVITVLINNSNNKNGADSLIEKQSEQKTRMLIIDFLKESFDLKHQDKNPIIGRVMRTSFKDLQAILPTYPIYVNSFFWLTSPGILLEVVYWSLFGLMASLLFGVTSAPAFDPKLIPEHIGKFFYTPFLVIIIYLSLNALTNEGSIVLEGEGKGTIVLAFVLGFYTRRAIVLLGKIKDIILPAKDREPWTIQVPTQKDPYKALKIEDQKAVVDEFIQTKSTEILQKYPAIKLLVAMQKPEEKEVKAYYFIQISLKENEPGKDIPTDFEYTTAQKVSYKIPAEIKS